MADNNPAAIPAERRTMTNFRRWELKFAIQRADVRQYALAHELGHSAPWMSQVIAGIADPTPDERRAIARKFNRCVAELFPEIAEP